MACPSIAPGGAFLRSVLAHIDCQAQVMGAYGYGALSDPGSTVSFALTGLLVLFVAIFGIRLMLGQAGDRGDLVGMVLKLGIVLTLATSWPALRTVAYDVVVEGPGELVRSIAGPTQVSADGVEGWSRLEAIDQWVIAVTSLGTGKLPGSDLRDEFRGHPLPDESGFGWGRVIFLIGAIAPFAIVRLGAGLLLALAPLLAAALLFERTSFLFFGWARGLAFAFLGALSSALLVGVEIAILEPWARETAAIRVNGVFAPAAATELLVVALTFLIAQVGLLTLLGRVAFHPHSILRRVQNARVERDTGHIVEREQVRQVAPADVPPSRAQVIANSVAMTMQREGTGRQARDGNRRLASPDGEGHAPTGNDNALGSSFRRSHRRSGAAALQRDKRP